MPAARLLTTRLVLTALGQQRCPEGYTRHETHPAWACAATAHVSAAPWLGTSGKRECCVTKGLYGSYKSDSWRLLSIPHFSVLFSSSLHPCSKKTAIQALCFPVSFSLFLTFPLPYFSFMFFCTMPSTNKSNQLHHCLLTDLYQGKSKPALPTPSDVQHSVNHLQAIRKGRRPQNHNSQRAHSSQHLQCTLIPSSHSSRGSLFKI